MSSPTLNDSLIVEAKYDGNRGLDWYPRDPGFDRNKLQDTGFDRYPGSEIRTNS